MRSNRAVEGVGVGVVSGRDDESRPDGSGGEPPGRGPSGSGSSGGGQGSPVPPWDPSGDPRDRTWNPTGGGAGPGAPSGPFPQQGPSYQQPGYQQPGYQQPGYQQGQSPYPPPAGGAFGSGSAPKPGVVPLRPLGVGEVLDGAVSYIRAHPKVVLGASAVVAVISQLVQVPLVYGLTSGTRSSFAPGRPPTLDQMTTVFAGTAAGGGAGGLINVVATTILTGLLMVVISRSVLGAPVDAGECWRAARPRVLGLLGVVLLSGLIAFAIVVVAVIPGALLLLVSRGVGIAVMVLGGIAGVVAAIWVAISLSLASPAYVLEGVGVTEALRRSFFLVKGRWWPVFGIQLLAGLIAAVISGIIGVPFGLIASAIAGPSPVPGLLALTITAVGTIIGLTLVAPFQSGVTGLLYVDQRMRREGFDIELQRASAGGQR